MSLRVVGAWPRDGELFAEGGTLVVRCGAQVAAYRDACPHLGVRLSEGTLADGVLTCSAHGWQFDAASGEGINPRGRALVRRRVERIDGMCALEVDDVRVGGSGPRDR